MQLYIALIIFVHCETDQTRTMISFMKLYNEWERLTVASLNDVVHSFWFFYGQTKITHLHLSCFRCCFTLKSELCCYSLEMRRRRKIEKKEKEMCVESSSPKKGKGTPSSSNAYEQYLSAYKFRTLHAYVILCIIFMCITLYAQKRHTGVVVPFLSLFPQTHAYLLFFFRLLSSRIFREFSGDLSWKFNFFFWIISSVISENTRS